MAKLLTATQYIADRVFPVCFFTIVGSLSLSQLTDQITHSADELQQLKLVHEILSITFAALIVTLFVIRRKPIGQRASLPARLVAIGGTYVTSIIVVLPPTTDDWRVLAAGNLLMIVGLLGTVYALGTLGKCFGIAPEARGLVTSGPYRWVRNPAYSAEFVTAFGSILPLLAPLTILIFALFVLLQLRRIAMEEAVLSATFPEYADYRRRTPALIPSRLLRIASVAG